MELADLVGEKMFSGIDFENDKVKALGFDGQCVNFILDNKTYTAVEDPQDGYRSSMREIKEGITQVRNIFPPVKVLARMKPDGKHDVLELINIANGKTVFEVGTENYGDGYPYWVARFSPENI